MQIRIDKAANALYIAFGQETDKRGVVAHSERIPNKPIVLDYDQDGKIFGIELFDVSACSEIDYENVFLQFTNTTKPLVK